MDVARPTRITALGGIPIMQLAAGAAHCIAISQDGAAYAWGCGLDGALGIGVAGGVGSAGGADSSSRHMHRGGGVLRLPAGLGSVTATPVLVEAPGLDDEDIVQVRCGAKLHGGPSRHNVCLGS